MPFERTCQVDQDLWLQRGGRACLVVVSQRQSISLTEHAEHAVERRIGKSTSKAYSKPEHAEKGGLESQRQRFLSQSTQRKAGWKVKRQKLFLTESAEHAEKGGFKRQKHFWPRIFAD